MNKSIAIVAVAFAFSPSINAYESMQKKTPVGEVKILNLPERVALETHSETSYFKADNGLFRKLFRYIDSNGISMTTPVEAEINPGKMRFFVGYKDQSKTINSTKDVKIKTVPPLKVLSIGIRGGYTEERFQTNKNHLISWIKRNKAYEIAGKPYAVYWNGPFVPGFLKRSEVHIPIKKKIINRQGKGEDAK